MWRTLLAYGMIVGTVGLAACGTDFTAGTGGGGAAPGGSGGTSTSSGSTTSSGTAGDGGCSADSVPVPPIPADWSGPAKIATASSTAQLPSCSGTETLNLHSGLDFEPPTCDCDCDAPLCQAFIGYYNNNTCEGTPPASQVVGEGCTAVSAGGQAAKWTTRRECPPLPTIEIPDPEWQNHLRACAIFGAGAEQSCAPAPDDPFQPALCVVREGGGHACPPGYENGLELFYDYSDSRDCTPACTCSPASVQCEDALNTHSTANCLGGTVSQWAEDNCITSLNFPAVGYLVTNAGGSCVESDPQAVGTVTATNPFTVCCTPP